MEDPPANPEANASLEYGTAPAPSRAWWIWPVLFGGIQFLWIPLLSLGTLSWDGPKQLVPDSMYMLLMAVPTIAAILTSVLGWRYYAPRGRLSGGALICIGVFLVSMFAFYSQIHTWVTDVLLDRNGRWYPL